MCFNAGTLPHVVKQCFTAGTFCFIFACSCFMFHVCLQSARANAMRQTRMEMPLTDSLPTLFPLIFDSINEGVFTVDEEFNVTSFNSAAENIVGMKRDEAIGKKCYEVFKASICEGGCALAETLRTGRPQMGVRVDIRNSDEQTVPIRVNTTALRDRTGTLIGGVEIFRDITDVESLRSELSDRNGFMDLVGRSDAMKELYSLIPQVAGSDAPVLICGASGTGKELVAQAIHGLSRRKNKPYVRLNCGALPDTLLESELFGYMKGAFTGANQNKPGRFQQADGGTLFLDEIGDVSPAFQVKLLRALEEGEIQPLGGTRTVKVKVRLITATNRDLRAMVKQGQFREDLYYRVKVIPIEIPRLSLRRKDIPLLVDHFTAILATKAGRSAPSISQKAMRVLFDYDYPGNVRELRNIIERAFVLCAGSVIDVQHLPPEVVDHSRRCVGLDPYLPRTPEEQISLSAKPPSRRAESEPPEKQRLIGILDEYGWNRTAVAKRLGIGRTTLWRRMKDYGMV